MNNFTIKDLSGIDVYDYYYPHWVGCGGLMFRYKPPNQQFYLFSLSYSDFKDICEVLKNVNPNSKSEILNGYIQNLDDFEDIISNSINLINDKLVFIDNLSLVNKEHIEGLYKLNQESYSFPNDVDYLYKIIRDLIDFLKLSCDYEVEYLYI